MTAGDKDNSDEAVAPGEVKAPGTMLWARHARKLVTGLTAALGPLLEDRFLDLTPESAAKELIRTAVKYDMSRSATRLRRRLYAQWRSPLALTEFVCLGPQGWGLRPIGPEPNEVGDACLDQFKVLSLVRCWGLPEKERLTPAQRVDAWRVILNVLLAETKTGQPMCSPVEAGVLWSLHANEGGKKVKRDSVPRTVGRYLPGWGVALPNAAELGGVLELLQRRGFIKVHEDAAHWKLQDWAPFSF